MYLQVPCSAQHRGLSPSCSLNESRDVILSYLGPSMPTRMPGTQRLEHKQSRGHRGGRAPPLPQVPTLKGTQTI